MKIENFNAQIKKGVLEYCILHLVSQQDAYASEIIKDMKKAKIIVVEGTLYPLLTRLKNDGHLSYRWEESKQGPPRKYYTITESGKKHLNQLDQSWNELNTGVNHIIHKKAQH